MVVLGLVVVGRHFESRCPALIIEYLIVIIISFFIYSATLLPAIYFGFYDVMSQMALGHFLARK